MGERCAAQAISLGLLYLYGAHHHDALVLDHRPEGWVVFYSERGEENVLARYDSEEEACLDILKRLLANEHNRYDLVAGPAPAEQADAQFADWLQQRGLDPSDLSEGELKTDEVPWEAGARPFRRYFVHRRRIRDAT